MSGKKFLRINSGTSILLNFFKKKHTWTFPFAWKYVGRNHTNLNSRFQNSCFFTCLLIMLGETKITYHWIGPYQMLHWSKDTNMVASLRVIRRWRIHTPWIKGLHWGHPHHRGGRPCAFGSTVEICLQFATFLFFSWYFCNFLYC